MSALIEQSTTHDLKKEAEEKYLNDEKDENFRFQLRQLNAANESAVGGKREKSIAKVQKFVNKLKRFVDTDKDGILSELSKLDVLMHLSEVCDALCESGIRLKDVFAIVEVSSVLYRQYSTEFSKPFCASILKTFRASDSTASKRRSLPRLAIELVLVGVFQESDALPGIINDLCDASAQEELLQHNIGVIEMICRKFDSAILGESGFKQEALDTALGKSLSRQCCLSRKAQQSLRLKLIEFYRSNAQQVLLHCDTAVKERQAANQQRRINKGTIDAESESKYQMALSTLTRLRTQLASIGDILRQPAPTLDVQEETEPVTRMQQDAQKVAADVRSAAETLTMWEDEAERDFYENILDLSDAVPGSLLGLKERGAGVGVPAEAPGDDVEIQVVVESTSRPTEQDKADGDKVEASEKRNVLLEQFFVKLTQASTGAEVDEVSIAFCYDQLNMSKVSRKKVVKSLLTTRRTDLFLLPNMARFVATVGPYCKEISQGVVEGVMTELKELIAEKNPLKVESKMKAVRYLGELCKFQLVPPGTVMDTLNTLFEDFSHHHIEMACQLIDSCGRYLMCFPGTTTRFENILSKMLRMKNVRNLPVHLEIMVEDAYFQLHPSDRKSKAQRELPPVRKFINHLIFVELHRRSDDGVLRSIRRLNWDDPDVPKWLTKAILNVGENVAFHQIGNVASLLCALVPGRAGFVLQCIDTLLESVQIGLERNDFRETPTRIRQMKFIGELFNFRLFDTSMIFDALFHLIGFGGPTSFGASDIRTAHKVAAITGNTHLLPGAPIIGTGAAIIGTPIGTNPVDSAPDSLIKAEQNQSDGPDVPTQQVVYPLIDPTSPLDPPGDFFRIRLVCVILDSCGQYFCRGTSGEKMDRFLKFFQRYILNKAPLPMSIQYAILDTLEKLRPKMKL